MNDVATCSNPAQGGRLAAYEFGLLNSDERHTFEAHLETCDFCCEEIYGFAPYTEALKAKPGLHPDRAPRKRWAPWAAATAAVSTLALVLTVVLLRPADLTAVADLTPLPYVAMETRSGETPETFQEAMAAYSAGRYEVAAELLDDLPETTAPGTGASSLRLAPVYLGISQLLAGQTDNAERSLERARTSDNDLISQRATWYLAQTKLVKNDREGALMILRDLTASPLYSAAAQQQISRLSEEHGNE